MRKFFYFALALAFASCTNNEDLNYGIQDNEIRLTSGVVSSRAATQSTQIVKDEPVYAWLNNYNLEVVKAWKLTADGEGHLNGNRKYYPDGVSSLKGYAVHANSTITDDSSLPATIEHTVLADQTNVAGYVKSDLLFAIKDEVKKGEENPLNFYHMLSKVEVKLIAGEGYTNEQLSAYNVSILGVKPTATLTIDPAKTEAEIAGLSVRKAMIAASGEPITISIPTKTDDYAEAIIVPQTLQGYFIQIKSEGVDLCYALETAKEFESGKNYKFDIKIGKTGLDVSSTISEWEDGGTTEGMTRRYSEVEKTLKAKDLLSGAVRDANTQEFKGYYFFDEGFTVITSYIIESNGNTDLKVETQAVTVSEDGNTASWATAFAGINSMTLSEGNIKIADGLLLDANSNGARDLFENKSGHMDINLDRNSFTCTKGNMSTAFIDMARLHTFDVIELNKEWYWDLVLCHNGGNFTFYKTRGVNYLSKDLVSLNNEDGYECEPEFNADADKTPIIEGMLDSYYDTNIVVKANGNDQVETAPFYLINKAGKGWFLFVRQ